MARKYLWLSVEEDFDGNEYVIDEDGDKVKDVSAEDVETGKAVVVSWGGEILSAEDVEGLVDEGMREIDEISVRDVKNGLKGMYGNRLEDVLDEWVDEYVEDGVFLKNYFQRYENFDFSEFYWGAIDDAVELDTNEAMSVVADCLTDRVLDCLGKILIEKKKESEED